MKKFAKYIRNSKGLSMVEVLMALGLVGAIGFGYIKLNTKVMQTEKSIISSSDSVRVTDGVRELFASLEICTGNLMSLGSFDAFTKSYPRIGIYQQGTYKSTFLEVDSTIADDKVTVGPFGIFNIQAEIEHLPGATFPPPVTPNELPVCDSFIDGTLDKDKCLMQRTEAANMNAIFTQTGNGLYVGRMEFSVEFVKCLKGGKVCDKKDSRTTKRSFMVDFQGDRDPSEIDAIQCLSPDSEKLADARYNFCNSVDGVLIGYNCFSRLYNPCGDKTGSDFDTCASTYNDDEVEATGFAKVNDMFCDIGSRVYAKSEKYTTDYCSFKGLATGQGALTESENVQLSETGCTLPEGETDVTKQYMFKPNALMQFFEGSTAATCDPEKDDDGNIKQSGYPTSGLVTCCTGTSYYYQCKWSETDTKYKWEKVATETDLVNLITEINTALDDEIAAETDAEAKAALESKKLTPWDTAEDYPITEYRDPNMLYLVVDGSILGENVYKEYSSLTYSPKAELRNFYTFARIQTIKDTYKANNCTNTKDITKEDYDKINPVPPGVESL